MLLRHYGPVHWASGTVPVQVWWRLSGYSGPWTALPSGGISVIPGGNAREIGVKALTAFDFDALFDYKITPVASVLKCTGVTNEPDVDGYEYILHAQ